MIEITGKCLGLKTKTYDGAAQYFFGIGEPKLGGFAEEMQVHEIKITKELNTPQFLNQIEGLQGKVIKAGVSLWKGQVDGTNYASFSSTGVIKEIAAQPGNVKQAA